jgi:hypothetical protein
MTDEPEDLDIVNCPPHYYAGTRWECIDVIEVYHLGYHLGNAFRYLVRHQHKGTPRQDLEKAVWYLESYATSNLAQLVQESAWVRPVFSLLGFRNCSAHDVVRSFGLSGTVAAIAVGLLEVHTVWGYREDTVLELSKRLKEEIAKFGHYAEQAADPDSEAKIEEQQRIRDHIAANYSADGDARDEKRLKTLEKARPDA